MYIFFGERHAVLLQMLLQNGVDKSIAAWFVREVRGA